MIHLALRHELLDRSRDILAFTAVDGCTRLAHDGEIGTECDEARFNVKYRALPVFRPLP